MLDIGKRFGAVTALKNASLSLMPGEIRALLGANGSGKSTLVKILGGMVKLDSGNILLDGKPLLIQSPRDSRQNAIAVAYQDLSLVPQLSVADNIMLGREPRGRAGLVESARVRQGALELLNRLQVEVDPDALVSELDTATQSLVEVAKALAWEPRMLVLDEVTASLHHDQVQRLFALLRGMRQSGLAILFVSHRFDEVFSLCDTATVLRGGETMSAVSISQVDYSDLIHAMTGKWPEKIRAAQLESKLPKKRDIVLSLSNLHVQNKVKRVSLKVHSGEIVGLGGLQGQGQAETLRAIFGAVSFSEGDMVFGGAPVKFRSPGDAVRQGIGFISGDREREGVLPVRSVTENLFLAKMALKGFFSTINSHWLFTGAKETIRQLKIVAEGPDSPANSLSGGNQQKLVVGRWLMVKPRLLLLDDPTKGVDINARREIHQLLRQMAEHGTTIIISSSDNEELLDIADRILVFYEGKVVAELCNDQKTEAQLVSAMLGVNRTSGGGDD
ncbi:MAG: sugar ABC transporter ATP-binding protein [Firmicutes bacterium]|nr:sugar ABC transporter ATP-binding protein [Bacillota bacterium]